MARSWYESFMIPEARAGRKFGGGAVDKMRGAGMSDALILAGKRKYGYTMTPTAQAMFPEGTYKGNWLTDFFGAQGGFGGTAYENVRDMGHDPRVIGRDMYRSGLRVGGKVEGMIADDIRTQRDREHAREAENRSLQQQGNEALLALAQKEVPVVEPTMPGAGGHFVPGTTKFQTQVTAAKGKGSSSKKDRFKRKGEGFTSALHAGALSSLGIGSSSKVLNV